LYPAKVIATRAGSELEFCVGTPADAAPGS